MTHRAIFRASALLSIAALAGIFAGCSRKASVEAILKQADALFAQDDYAKAEIEYKNALARNNAEASAHAISRLGVIYAEQGRLGTANRFLRRAIELRPDDLEAKHRLALFEIINNKPDEARKSAIAILEKNPRHPEAPFVLADTSTKPEEIADSRTRLTRLPGGAAEGAPALIALALLDLRERKLKECEALLDRAVKLEPKSAFAASARGQLHLAQKDLARAEKAFGEAAELSSPRSRFRIQNARLQWENGHPDVARRLLEQIIARTPDFLPPYLLLATLADTEKKSDEAGGLIEKVLAREPDHPEAMVYMAQWRLNQGEKEKSAAIMERAVAIYPRSYSMHYQLGLAQLAMGNLSAASTTLTQALRLEPGFQPAAYALARLQISQRDFVNAVRLLAPFASHEPAIPEARSLMAAALRGQGSLDEALKLYRQLAQSQPDVPDHRLIEGAILLQQNKPAEARRTFAALAEKSPDFLPATEALVNMDAADRQFSAAADRINAYLARSPKSGPAYLILARVHLQQPDHAKAEAALLKFIELDPDNAAGYAQLSTLYIETGQTDKAIAKLKDTAAKNPRDFTALFVLGTLQESQRNFPAARDAYEKAIAVNPKLGQALNNLAYLYAEQLADLDKALDAAQRAREAVPASPEIADTLGWILFKKRQYPRALALLQESADKLPENPDVQFHLGLAAYMLGQEETARRALQQALKLRPDFAGADEAKQALAVLAADPAGGAASRAVLEKAIAARKDDAVANLRLAALLERDGAADKAFAAYESALKANPSLVPAALGLMRLHAARNEPAKALALGRETRKLVPADAALAAALARLSFQAGDFPGALVLIQEAVRRQPENFDLLFDLAEVAYPMGQLTTTENALGDALRALPSSPRAAKARQFQELIALAQKPTEAAAQAAAAALKAEPTNVAALMVRAALDEKGGNAKAAQQAYDQILARWPEFNPAKRRLAVIYSAMPEPPKNALDVANKAREAFPADAELARATGLIAFRQGNFSRAASLLQDSARTLGSDAELMYYLGRAQLETKDAAGKRSLQRALDLGLKAELAGEARRLLAPPPEKK